ncbi:hypothetical protein Z043_119355 [Scleropages formosus]|uniref:Uncharacterized protein n=1 Tax=Scleropages formosus TaxID=113540 RepID=A0A0P7U5A3_SCLFO|nr:hypothetical protein Z043_119355 [Scleropages formosus]
MYIRNLCYMLSWREKLKLSHCKAQEQIFNLQVALINHELSHSVLSVGDWDVPQPPPRLMLKLKVPKVIIGNGKTSSKSNRTLFRS